MKFLLSIILLIFISNGYSQEIFLDSTFVVREIPFRVITGSTDSNSYAQIIRKETDTTTIVDMSGNIEILKFNSDEHLDITLTFIGNNIVTELYLFDEDNLEYRKVESFEWFPEAKQLASNPYYYFSYHRSGCADMNWGSDLFYIEDFKAKRLGNISGIGCISDEKNGIIEVSNVKTQDSLSIFEILPIDTIETYDKYKWGFIEDYWGKNLKFFLD